MEQNKLYYFRGEPYSVNDKIQINHPKIGEIGQFGEKKYWSLVSTLTASSYDFRFQLDDLGYDYEEIDDFTVFCLVCPTLSLDDTSILFGHLDFQSFNLIEKEDDFYLENNDGVKIDKVIYELIVSYLRTIHFLKRQYKSPGNKAARHYYLVEERKKLENKLKNGKETDSSILANAVSCLVNCSDFKYDYNTIWDVPIYAFLDAINRIQKNINYNNLMTGIYTGNIDASKIPESQKTWLGGL